MMKIKPTEMDCPVCRQKGRDIPKILHYTHLFNIYFCKYCLYMFDPYNNFTVHRKLDPRGVIMGKILKLLKIEEILK